MSILRLLYFIYPSIIEINILFALYVWIRSDSETFNNGLSGLKILNYSEGDDN